MIRSKEMRNSVQYVLQRGLNRTSESSDAKLQSPVGDRSSFEKLILIHRAREVLRLLENL